MYENIATGKGEQQYSMYIAAIYCSTAGRPVLEETGIVLHSALSTDGGLFLLVANQSTPSADGDHAIVARISDENGNEYYHWQVTISLSLLSWHSPLCWLQTSIHEALDLRSFSCRNVNVSIAVVNRNGTSNFTTPTRVFVYGGK